MGLFDWMRGKAGTLRPAPAYEHSRNPLPAAAPVLSGSGGYEYEVVGESYRQDALAEICGGRCEEGHNKKVLVTLRPDPGNRADTWAVRVEIDRQHVGYLPADDLARYHDDLKRIGLAGRAVNCRGVVVGGWHRPRKNGPADTGLFGIKLDIDYPLEVE